MAETIQMIQRPTGIAKTGFYGFSWTTFFFGGFPALFRGDFLTFLGLFAVMFVIGLSTGGIGGFAASLAWAFIYNSYYTKKLLEKGYEFIGTDDEIAKAKKALNIFN